MGHPVTYVLEKVKASRGDEEQICSAASEVGS
jgi:hypothetical protein